MPQWYYTQYGQQQAPVEQEQLVNWLATGQLSASELVWMDGMSNWLPAAQVPGLASQLPPSAPAGYPGYPQAQPLAYQSPGYPGYINYSTPAPASGYASLARAAMILGCCSFVVGTFLTGLAALICGWIALNGMKRTGNYQNKGYAITGVAIGCFWVLAIIAIIILIVIVNSGK